MALGAVPESNALFEAYPNPFNPETTIEYNLVEGTQVSIRVYDLIGREMETLVEDYRDAGRHQVTWLADRFASGTYFIVMKTATESRLKKVLLLK